MGVLSTEGLVEHGSINGVPVVGAATRWRLGAAPLPWKRRLCGGPGFGGVEGGGGVCAQPIRLTGEGPRFF